MGISHSGVGAGVGGISQGVVGIPQQQVRQSALEKSLSLQAELAQQRPLSMVVPFGALEQPGNAIVNQVADSLLQQARALFILDLICFDLMP